MTWLYMQIKILEVSKLNNALVLIASTEGKTLTKIIKLNSLEQ